MHLVIDGYNLLHRLPGFSGAQGRRALLLALKIYRDQKRHKLTLVFDGGPDPQPTRASEQGIPIIQSGGEKSADDIIAEMAARHGPGITVVTDDRELAQRCQAHGSQVIACWEFSEPLLAGALGSDMPDCEREDQGWNFSTRKKGPSRRLPKKKRRKAQRLRRL